MNISTNFVFQCSNMSVVRFKKIFFTFVVAEKSAHTYWKVFSHVLCGKCGSFQNRRIDGQHSFLVYSIVKGRSVRPDVSHIYRVWGIGAFISVQVFPQPSTR